MKKKLVSILLCAALLTSLFCINTFAMADKSKVISIDNIYNIVYTENPQIAITDNSIASTSGVGMPVILSYSTSASLVNSKQSQKKIAYNGEQTLLSYYTTQNSVEKLNAQLKSMDKTISAAKTRLNLGMISQLDYDNMLLNQKNLQQNLATSQATLKKATGALNLLINNAFDDEIHIADFAPLDLFLIETLDKDKCYQDAVFNSMDLEAYRIRLDGAILADTGNRTTSSTGLERQSAYYSYITAQKELDQNFDLQWDGLLQSIDNLKIQSLNLDSLERKYTIALIKYQLGMISSLDYNTAGQDYNNAKIDHENAQVSLYATYKKFMALVSGVSM